MTDGLEITAWTYDTPNRSGTWNGNLSWHKPMPIGTANATPLYTRETLEKAVLAEREACAKLCDDHEQFRFSAGRCAQVIRSRSEQ